MDQELNVSQLANVFCRTRKCLYAWARSASVVSVGIRDKMDTKNVTFTEDEAKEIALYGFGKGYLSLEVRTFYRAIEDAYHKATEGIFDFDHYMTFDIYYSPLEILKTLSEIACLCEVGYATATRWARQAMLCNERILHKTMQSSPSYPAMFNAAEAMDIVNIGMQGQPKEKADSVVTKVLTAFC